MQCIPPAPARMRPQKTAHAANALMPGRLAHVHALLGNYCPLDVSFSGLSSPAALVRAAPYRKIIPATNAHMSTTTKDAMGP